MKGETQVNPLNKSSYTNKTTKLSRPDTPIPTQRDLKRLGLQGDLSKLGLPKITAIVSGFDFKESLKKTMLVPKNGLKTHYQKLNIENIVPVLEKNKRINSLGDTFEPVNVGHSVIESKTEIGKKVKTTYGILLDDLTIASESYKLTFFTSGGSADIYSMRFEGQDVFVKIQEKTADNSMEREYNMALRANKELSEKILLPSVLANFSFSGKDGKAYQGIVMQKIEGRSLESIIRKAFSINHIFSKEKEAWLQAFNQNLSNYFLETGDLEMGLKDDLDALKKVKCDWANKIVQNLKEAVTALHEHHIYHLDIKPGNIVVKKDGSIAIVDFGNARFCDANTEIVTEEYIGTPDYVDERLYEDIDAETLSMTRDKLRDMDRFAAAKTLLYVLSMAYTKVPIDVSVDFREKPVSDTNVEDVESDQESVESDQEAIWNYVYARDRYNNLTEIVGDDFDSDETLYDWLRIGYAYADSETDSDEIRFV